MQTDNSASSRRESVGRWLLAGGRTPLGRIIILLSLLIMALFAAGYLYIAVWDFDEIERIDRERNARNAEIAILNETLMLTEQNFDAAHGLLSYGIMLYGGGFPRAMIESHINVELLAAEQAQDALRQFLIGRGSGISSGLRADIAREAAAQQAAVARMQEMIRGKPRGVDAAGAARLFEARDAIRRHHTDLAETINAEVRRLKVNFDSYAQADLLAQREARNKAVAGVLLVEALTLLLGLMELAAAGRAALAAQSMDEEREKYKKLMEQAGDAAIVTDADTGVITEINRKGEELLGMPRAGVVGKPHGILFPPAERARYLALFAEMIARGGPDEAGTAPKRITIVRADGAEVPVEVRCSLIVAENRRLLQGIYRDVAAQQAQEKLKEQQAAAQMELVRQTVEALEEARNERKKADEANRLKSEFVANMSHELRTPLTSILGYSRIARERMDDIVAGLRLIRRHADQNAADSPVRTPVPDEIAGQAARAEQAIAEIASFGDVVVGQGERLLQLINDLLDMSSLEAGQLRIQEHVSSARMILNSVASRLSGAAGEKQIRLTVNVRAVRNTDIFFLGDTPRIEQIIFNLAQNAIKYSRGGEVLISATADGTRLLFSVKDQGIGIPAEHHEAIFDSFRQLDGGNTRIQGGVGLGLTLSRKLVTAMGGTIGVESAEGKGSEFTVALPYRPVDA